MSLSPNWFTLWRWQRRVRRAKRGMTRPEVIEAVGEPSRIDKLGDYAVWYYDLKRVRGADYSLRVAFADDLVCQAYVGFDLGGQPAG